MPTEEIACSHSHDPRFDTPVSFDSRCSKRAAPKGPYHREPGPSTKPRHDLGCFSIVHHSPRTREHGRFVSRKASETLDILLFVSHLIELSIKALMRLLAAL